MDKDRMKASIAEMLSNKEVFHGVPEPLTDSSRFVLDSLSVFWLSHRLSEDWGIQLDLDAWDWEAIYSIDKLLAIALRSREAP